MTYGYRWDNWGITELASAHFVSSWECHYESGLAIIEKLARVQDPGTCQEYLFDAELLAASPLTADQLAALWRTACGGRHHPDIDGLDGRGWMLKITEIMRPPVEAAGLDVLPGDEIDRRPEAIGRVIRAVRRLSVVYNFPRDPVDEEYLRRAMLDLIECGLPEPAFRFFLLAVIKHYSPVDRPFYDELQETSRLFGYGWLFVQRLAFLLPDGDNGELADGP